eukprot:CAMPEP_0170635302 /NCGR_PEP_ID=MMETSP0224-20130122/37137_1 /TAXON_ID=285029 /ORGANISM="Togula jolla, Strain CCCM 725" /LENGTH=558 /DNA_ID=CAMNT_0010964769 /DNA_START=15 /DNA_END=1689 /DNA_ORIENTATION=+
MAVAAAPVNDVEASILGQWSSPSGLHSAAASGRVDICRELLSSGADPDGEQSFGCGTALHAATFAGHGQVIQVLLEGRADPNACDENGQTPLFFAPTRAIGQSLVSARADINKVNHAQQSALHLVAHAGLAEVLEWLAGRHDVAEPPNLQDSAGCTAADYAVWSRSRATARLLQLRGIRRSRLRAMAAPALSVEQWKQEGRALARKSPGRVTGTSKGSPSVAKWLRGSGLSLFRRRRPLGFREEHFPCQQPELQISAPGATKASGRALRVRQTEKCPKSFLAETPYNPWWPKSAAAYSLVPPQPPPYPPALRRRHRDGLAAAEEDVVPHLDRLPEEPRPPSVEVESAPPLPTDDRGLRCPSSTDAVADADEPLTEPLVESAAAETCSSPRLEDPFDGFSAVSDQAAQRSATESSESRTRVDDGLPALEEAVFDMRSELSVLETQSAGSQNLQGLEPGETSPRSTCSKASNESEASMELARMTVAVSLKDVVHCCTAEPERPVLDSADSVKNEIAKIEVDELEAVCAEDLPNLDSSSLAMRSASSLASDLRLRSDDVDA